MMTSSAMPASVGSILDSATLGPRPILRRDSSAVFAAKGFWPVRACHTTTASEKMSARSSTRSPSICSGGM